MKIIYQHNKFDNDYLKKIHKSLLYILDYVTDLCDKNNIAYYIVGGTLLGAVRHNGFIPWDDDIDLAMSRECLEKLVKLIKSDQDSNFHILYRNTNKNFDLPFAKVCLNNTLFVETALGNPFSHPISIDIFPLDCVNRINKILLVKKFIYKTINIIYAVKSRKIQHPKTFVNILAKFLPKRFLHIVGKLLVERKKDLKYYANFGSKYKINKQTFLKEYYGKGSPLLFENKLYNAPSEYRKILISLYGENYMIVPPPEKQITHYPKKIIFSNGTEYNF